MPKQTVQDQKVVSRHLLRAEVMSSPESISLRDSQQLNHAKSYVYRLDVAGVAH